MPEAVELAYEALEAIGPNTVDDLEIAAWAAKTVVYAQDPAAGVLLEGILARARSGGAAALHVALVVRSELDVLAGRLGNAYAVALEAVGLSEILGGWRVARPRRRWRTSKPSWDGTTTASATPQWASSRAVSTTAGCRHRVTVRSACSRSAVATWATPWPRSSARSRSTGRTPTPGPLDCYGDQIEALLLAGQRDEALHRLGALEQTNERVRSQRTREAIRRCRLLDVDPADLDRVFADGVAVADGSPLDRARTHLVYGERLRQAARRVDGRCTWRSR